jgi:RNA polymerase sigma factor (sigma-70 family)
MTQSAICSRTSRTPRWLIEAAQEGDPAAERELVRRYEPLVQRVVWSLRLPPGCEREDLAQEARVGLAAAIRAWQPERGPFPALAERLRQQPGPARARNRLPTQAPAPQPRGIPRRTDHHDRFRQPAHAPRRPPCPRDARTDPESRLLAHEQLSCLLRALPTLTANERTVLAGSLSGRSYKQMAPAQFGTWRAAEHAHYRARRKLAAALPKAA